MPEQIGHRVPSGDGTEIRLTPLNGRGIARAFVAVGDRAQLRMGGADGNRHDVRARSPRGLPESAERKPLSTSHHPAAEAGTCVNCCATPLARALGGGLASRLLAGFS